MQCSRCQGYNIVAIPPFDSSAPNYKCVQCKALMTASGGPIPLVGASLPVPPAPVIVPKTPDEIFLERLHSKVAERWSEA